MYTYYDHGQEMLENVFRDSPQVPAPQEILRLKWLPFIEVLCEPECGARFLHLANPDRFGPVQPEGREIGDRVD